MRTLTRRTFAAATTLLAAGSLAACGGSDDTAETTESAPPAAAPSTAPTTAMPSAAMMVGAGCADYAAKVPDGAGSVSGMAQDPVAVAAGNNPLLTQLTASVSGKLNPKVNLVDTLNGGEFTVFAPVDEAFGKLDAATVETLKTDDALLTKILTYHVVAGQLSPDQVAGMQKSVQGGTVEVTGSGDALKVNDANVICGGVQTANATVYLIDSVLMPPS